MIIFKRGRITVAKEGNINVGKYTFCLDGNPIRWHTAYEANKQTDLFVVSRLVTAFKEDMADFTNELSADILESEII